MNERPLLSPEARKWLPAAAAGGLLAIVVVAGVALGGGGGDEAAPAVSADSVALAVPAVSVDVIATVETTAPISKTVLARTLSKGMAGDDVAQVQQRLTDLGFWPGPVDGYFGDETRRATWAYEKLVLGVAFNQPTGAVSPDMWTDMQDPFVIQPRRTNSTPNHTEIYLPEQVIAVFHNDVPVMISHMSSGDNEDWCEEVTISPGEYNNPSDEPLVRGECGKSITPGGVFNYKRMVEGIRQGSLGGMWDPVYFNYGIAVHGALNVPLQPASHGCIRIPLSLSPSFQDLVAVGDQVFVFDGVKEPEAYGAQKPYFNRIDPDYSTTTSSTTSTTTTTTTLVPPSTTVPPTTTPPATTTTTSAATTTTTTTIPPAASP
ncbi:MAG TPA: L,D-transpeptidase family protein [Ilumatobacteraceae bacterium]|nr:L,D-transpeptidase family protein [Ilumatobacteraceae bacterium]